MTTFEAELLRDYPGVHAAVEATAKRYSITFSDALTDILWHAAETYAGARPVELHRAHTATCECCGEPFTAQRVDARFCGPTCRKRVSRARQVPPMMTRILKRETFAKPTTKPRAVHLVHCHRCGKPFHTTAGRALYCSIGCRNLNARARSKTNA